MRYLKQSTSVDLPIGPFLDSTDGITAETALTITQPDIRLKKNGGAWAQKNASQTLSHEENGYYEVTLDATDTNTLGCLRLAVHESGALPVWEEFMVMPANVWDAMFGTDKLQVDVAEFGNAAGTFASGRPEVKADSLGTTAKADVNAEVLDVLNVDTFTQPSAAPAATTTLRAMIGWLFTLQRNENRQTSGLRSVRNDANSANIATAVVSDDGTTAKREKWA